MDWLLGVLQASDILPFLRQLLPVFLGSFLGFVFGILLQRIGDRRRRRAMGDIGRNVLVVELLHNLRTLAQIEEGALKTQSGGFVVVFAPNSVLRTETVRGIVKPELLDGLTTAERRLLLEVAGQLEELAQQQEAWTDACRRADRLLPLTVGDGEQVAYVVYKTRILLRDIAIIQSNIIELLLRTVNRLRRAIDEEAERIAELIQPLDFAEDLPPFVRRDGNFYRAGKSSHLKNGGDLNTENYLVVWEHDWQECPLKKVIVIGLERSGSSKLL